MLNISKKTKKPFALIILDGWGIAPAWGGNAITKAKTKTFDTIWKNYPSTSLLASGQAVGLPLNSPGNSEAGHLNLGAGKVVHQDLTLIDQKIDDQSFFSNPVLIGGIKHAESHHSNIHIIGLLSKTGTHSHIKHLYALLGLMKKNNFNRVYIDLFSDGRDSDPFSGIEMISEVENEIKKIGVGKINSISGRFFAMDRDNRWGRVSRAYNLLVRGEGNVYESPKSAFSSAYTLGQTDEFIEPRLVGNKISNTETISNNDTVILFNFRNDRTKELAEAFLADKLPEFPDRQKLNNLYFASFAVYDDNPTSKQVFSPELIHEPIAKVWADQGLRQYHTAETEKFPHVTYFINGGVEKPFWGESRLMIPSPRNVKTYDYKPEMSAKEVTESLLLAINKNLHDAIILNYANADMVAHSGNLEATVIAVECVDACLNKVLSRITSLGGTAFICGDHGNAEQMVNPRTGQPDTEHTTNPVPFIIVSEDEKIKKYKLRSDGILSSVAPTILELMSIPKPQAMINQSLIIKEINTNESS